MSNQLTSKQTTGIK